MKNLMLTLAIGLCCFVSTIQAQNQENRWAVGMYPGILQYQGTPGSELFKLNESSAKVAIGAAYYLNSSFNIEGAIMGGNLDFEDSLSTFDSPIWDLTGNLVYKFNNGYILSEDAFLSPFLHAGGGPVYTKADGLDLTASLGGGLNFRFDDMFNLQLRTAYKPTTSDQYNSWAHTVGFVFGLAGKGEKAEKPSDRDGDGIIDVNDRCPDEAGLEMNDGCPEVEESDRDGDGIIDSEDRCPDVKGVASNEGCPSDRDGDGIIDTEDRCPDTKGVVANQGCPADRDRDGIADADDNCPDVPGVKANQGCPADSDGDGIIDADDHCPEEPGIVANAGCPEIDEETKVVLAEALEGIQFETGKNVIKTSSYPILDKVVALMKKHPEYRLEISGYTDNVGNPASNLELSKRRAASTRQFLIDKGISGDRMTSEGYGDANPIATNSTREGRAKNRRVEFKVNF